jgi:hypothetical protein
MFGYLPGGTDEKHRRISARVTEFRVTIEIVTFQIRATDRSIAWFQASTTARVQFWLKSVHTQKTTGL